MNKLYIIFILFLSVIILSPQLVHAQRSQQGVHFGIKAPYSYNFGYYQRFNTRWAMHADVQVITFPFSQTPTAYMKMWGADPKLVAILEEPFSIGAGVDLGLHYYFGSDNRRYYVGTSAQWMNLLKRDISDEVINEAFDVDLDGHEFPVGPIPKSDSKKPLTLNTNYVQLGFFAGKKWQLHNREWQLRLELGFSMNIYSHHNLQSDYRYITPVAIQANEELQKMMHRYAWFPTLNVFFIYIID
ncbi:MAG: hypothetical protein KAG64_08370 [Bacteroidales bacterium]|nr:hypothetical protein [Bacteroidales bacterium]